MGLGYADRQKSQRKNAMLAVRPNCEMCDCDLPPEAMNARICTYECTFCADCVDSVLENVCPNCGGELMDRPTRAKKLHANNPPSTKRMFKA